MREPFFATLALFANFRPTQQLTTAGTDGKDIFFNPEYLCSLPAAQQDGLLLHEVLHAALLHVLRQGVRDRQVWNIAADIVVNGMIAQQGGFELPPNGLRQPKLEHLSVEEIYELLLKHGNNSLSLAMPDLLSVTPENASSTGDQSRGVGAPEFIHGEQEHNCVSMHECDPQGVDIQDRRKAQSPGDVGQPYPALEAAASALENLDSLSQARIADLSAHWRNALQQAAIVAQTVNQGKLPAGMDREMAALTSAQLDWRSYLWRYLVQTPTDFKGFDRRFIGRGLYLETLVGESVQVLVAVDTSGSINPEQLRMFLSEVKAILNAYPHLQCELYYADAEAYGPYPLNSDLSPLLPSLKGGGGTSFVPFFSKVQDSWDGQTQGVCVYLTDGYGTFPDKPPELPVLWVVTPGGLDLQQFPFGEAVRLLSV